MLCGGDSPCSPVRLCSLLRTHHSSNASAGDPKGCTAPAACRPEQPRRHHTVHRPATDLRQEEEVRKKPCWHHQPPENARSAPNHSLDLTPLARAWSTRRQRRRGHRHDARVAGICNCRLTKRPLDEGCRRLHQPPENARSAPNHSLDLTPLARAWSTRRQRRRGHRHDARVAGICNCRLTKRPLDEGCRRLHKSQKSHKASSLL